MADFDAQLPVRTIATEFTTEVANASGTTINPVEEFAQGSTTSGQSGPLDQGAVTTAAPTYVTGTTQPLSLDTTGNLRVAGTFTPSGLQNVNITEIGGNVVTTTLPVSGTVTVANPGLTDTQLRATPVPVSGSVSVSNFPADADALAQGSTTSGQLGSLTLGAVTTASPSYTTGQTDPLSLTLAGALRVDGSAVTQPVSGTFWQATQPISAVSLPLPTGAATETTLASILTDANKFTFTATRLLVDGSGVTQPISGSVTVSNFPADADALAQASATSGQLGALTMGAVTTAAPTYTTGQTDPLSIDTAGNLRVVVSNLTGSVPVLTYFTDAAVATSATVTHSVAGPCVLDAVHGAGSGEIKMIVAIGVTSSEVTKWQGFTSAAQQNCEFELKNGYVIPSGSSVAVTLKNRDTSAQDLYLTIVTH